MSRPYTGKVTESRYEKLQKNGSIYVYKKLSWYDPTIRNTRSKLELLGIKTATGEIVSTRPKSSTSNSSVPNTPAVMTKKANATERRFNRWLSISTHARLGVSNADALNA